MANGNGGISIKQHQCHWFTKNWAAANYYGVFTSRLNTVTVKQTHNPFGGCTAVSFFTHAHATETQTGYAVYIFFRANCIKTQTLINLMRNRMLQQDAVHIRVII